MPTIKPTADFYFVYLGVVLHFRSLHGRVAVIFQKLSIIFKEQKQT